MRSPFPKTLWLTSILAVSAVALFAWHAAPVFSAVPASQDLANEWGYDVLTFDDAPPGTIVFETRGSLGSGPVAVMGTNPELGPVNAAVLFNSDAPSGGDPDLGSPNEDFGGPGIGAGGSQGSPNQNDRRLDQILIVANDLVDMNGDGLVDDPDDAAVLGTSLELDFAAIAPVTLHSVDLIDLEERPAPAQAELFDPNGALIGAFPLPILGDNGLTTFEFGGVCNVGRVVITLNGSGAIDNVMFDPLNRGGNGLIGDFIWNDEDGDGLQGPGEPGLPGIRVLLRNANGEIVEEVMTDGDGSYGFSNLCSGDYTVEIDLTSVPEGFEASPCNVGGDDTIDNDCSPASVTLPNNDTSDDSIDFGFTLPPTGTIGNFVWLDLNGNHIQDPQEAGIGEIGLLLRDDMGVLIGMTQTSQAGFYEFSGLDDGVYFVEVDETTVPAGLEIVLCDVGDDDEIESDCGPVRVELGGDNSTDLSIDFGFVVCGECVVCGGGSGDDDDEGDSLSDDDDDGGDDDDEGDDDDDGGGKHDDGCVTGITLRFLGAAPAFVEVRNANDLTELFFQDVVEPNGTFTFFGAMTQGEEEAFPSELALIVDGMQDATLDTTCTQPLGPGLVVGTFLIEAVDGEVEGIICRPNAIVCATGAPGSLAFRYVGGSCDVTRGRKAESLLSCFGDSESKPAVRIFAYDGDAVWFEGSVEMGGVFTLDASSAGARRLEETTWIDIYDARSGDLLQAVVFDSSCAQTLVVGDRFGSLELQGLAPVR